MGIIGGTSGGESMKLELEGHRGSGVFKQIKYDLIDKM